jgi:hypothetical protein
MEGGVIRYSGTAAELRERPDLLHSAYLLRGASQEAVEEAVEAVEAEAGGGDT